jgi:hypothetical protein
LADFHRLPLEDRQGERDLYSRVGVVALRARLNLMVIAAIDVLSVCVPRESDGVTAAGEVSDLDFGC